MAKTWSTEIKEILKIGKPLFNVGNNNWGLTKEQALEAIDLLSSANIPIYGGDVYELTGDIIKPNYDNWFCNPMPNELERDFLDRSITIAKNYILSYYKFEKIFFVLVPKN